MKFEILPLFSSPVYSGVTGLNLDNCSILSAHKFKDTRSGGSISETTILPSELPCIFEPIKFHVDNYLYNVLCLEDTFKYKFSDGWLVKVTPGGHILGPHRHANSLFSGVLYLKIPEGSSKIRFEKEIVLNDYCSMKFNLPIKEGKYNLYNSKFWTFTPSEGEILIFPSYLKHEILINKTLEDRISYSFNIVPSGIIQEEVGFALRYD